MPRRRLSASDKEILRKARILAKGLTAEGLALLNPGHELVYETVKREGHIPKKHRAGQLTDYSAVEIWIDLKEELGKHNTNIDRLYPMVLYLARLINA